MKKIFTLAVVLTIGLSGLAQNIPNSGFEFWTIQTLFEEPDGFTSTNTMIFLSHGSGNVSKSTDAISGNYSLKAQTIVSANDTAFGLIANSNLAEGIFAGGVAFDETPDSLTGWVKYDILTDDTAKIIAVFKYNTTIIAYAAFDIIGTQDDWTRISTPITFFIPAVPDSMVFIASSSNFSGIKMPGSTLFLDDFGFVGSAAGIPNGDFEDWTAFQTEEPDDWNTINFMCEILNPSVSKTTDAHDGTYALKVESVKTIFGDTLSIATLGTIDENGLGGGTPIQANPHVISGYYKYAPVGTDTALVGVITTKYNPTNGTTNGVDSFLLKLPAASAFTYFEMVLPGNLTLADTMNIMFAAGNFAEEHIPVFLGSVLIVDNLSITYHSVDVAKHSQQEKVSIYPNPASEFIGIQNLNVTNGETLQFKVYSGDGRLVLNETLLIHHNNESPKINISSLAKGVYYYDLQSENFKQSGSFSVHP